MVAMVAIVAVAASLMGLVVGAVISALLSRRWFKKAPGAFRCKVRVQQGVVRRLSPHWPRTASYALWVHDTLWVLRGTVVVRVCALGVRFADGPITPIDVRLVPGLGPRPVVLKLQLDDGPTVLIAASDAVRELVAGPYVVAQLLPM